MPSFLETFFSQEMDLLGFEKKIKEIKEMINLLNFVVVFGNKGDGKTFFLKNLSKELKDFQFLDFYKFISKRTKKNDKLIIDDFHLISLLDNEKILEILDMLKDKKIIISFNLKYIEKLDPLKKELIMNFLENSFYTVNLKDFYKDKEKVLVDLFLSIIEEEFGIKFDEESKEILSFIIKNKNFNILTTKKVFLHLYFKIKKDLEKEKPEKIDIKKYLPNNWVSSYYWYKELNGNKEKIDLSSIYNKKIKEIETNKKEKSENVMDINQIMDKYLESEREKDEEDLISLIKKNPSLIEKELFVYDYKDEIMYKGVPLNEIVKNTKKPSLIGYKEDRLYLIYIVEDLEKINVQFIESLSKLKEENKDLEFIIVTKKREKNKKYVEDYSLNKVFNIIEI
jgi:hypothetical protein